MSKVQTLQTTKTRDQRLAETKYKDDDKPMVNWFFVRKKLFTHEDKMNVHKTLGLCSLLSFIYRYNMMFRTGTLGFEGNAVDWVSMLLHMALSTSSLVFIVLQKRIITKPMVIWNEYRLHAIVFTLRCVSVYAIGILLDLSTVYAASLNFAIVGCHHLVVDYITKHYGDARQTTVRVLAGKDAKKKVSTFIKAGSRMYAFYQFLALGSHLIPHARFADMGFNTLIAIQSSAFLMTLFRKGLILAHTHMVVYSLCLIISSYYILSSHGVFFFMGVLSVFALRVNFGIDKYVLWGSFTTLFTLGRFYGVDIFQDPYSLLF